MRRQHFNEVNVYLVHTGNPDKMWDPEDEDIKFGSKPKGEEDDAVIHYVYNGEDGVIRPGDRFITSRGEAMHIIRQKTLHPEVWLMNKLTGQRERKTLNLRPPLQIIPLNEPRGREKAPIGMRVAEDEVVPEPKRDLPPQEELPDGYVKVDAPPKIPRTDKLKKEVIPPKPMQRSELAAKGKKTLRSMLEQIGITVEGNPSREEMVDMILKSQEG